MMPCAWVPGLPRPGRRRSPACRYSVPKTHLSAKEVFGGIPPDEIDLMTHKNAEKLFKFPLNQDLVASYSATT